MGVVFSERGAVQGRGIATAGRAVSANMKKPMQALLRAFPRARLGFSVHGPRYTGHGRACPSNPRLCVGDCYPWMLRTRPAMTPEGRASPGLGADTDRHRGNNRIVLRRYDITSKDLRPNSEAGA